MIPWKNLIPPFWEKLVIDNQTDGLVDKRTDLNSEDPAANAGTKSKNKKNKKKMANTQIYCYFIYITFF